MAVEKRSKKEQSANVQEKNEKPWNVWALIWKLKIYGSMENPHSQLAQ